MKFSQNLYTDEAALKNKKSIIHKLKRNRMQASVYVITLNLSTMRPELIHSVFLQQKYYKKNPPYVIGIAMSAESGMEILCKIVSENLTESGTINICDKFMEPKVMKRRKGGSRCTSS